MWKSLILKGKCFNPHSGHGIPASLHTWLCPRNEVLNKFHIFEEEKVVMAVSCDCLGFDLLAVSR